MDFEQSLTARDRAERQLTPAGSAGPAPTRVSGVAYVAAGVGTAAVTFSWTGLLSLLMRFCMEVSGCTEDTVQELSLLIVLAALLAPIVGAILGIARQSPTALLIGMAGGVALVALQSWLYWGVWM